VGETFEIWAAELWQNKQGELNAETNAKRFSLLDLRTH
jgi:DNA-binding transcriptional regulator/RsmH inhibitor MraZ